MPNLEISFSVQPRAEDNWCWAAVASSVSFHYDQYSTWSQCVIASGFFSQSCCPPVIGSPCDQMGSLQFALGPYGTNNLEGMYPGPLLPNIVQQQISGASAGIGYSRIIGAQITWPNGGGGHFLAINGFDDTSGTFCVYVADSNTNNSISSFVPLMAFNKNFPTPGCYCSYYHLTQGITAPQQQAQLLTAHVNLVKTVKKIHLGLHRKKKTRMLLRMPAKNSKIVAHDVAYIPLTSIIQGSPQIIDFAIRVFGTKNGTDFLSDFVNIEEERVELLAIVLDQAYIKRYSGTWTNIVSKQKTLKQKFSIKFVRQTELDIDAFQVESLVNSDKKGYIIFKGDRPFSGSDDYMSETAFFELLSNAAKNRQIPKDEFSGR